MSYHQFYKQLDTRARRLFPGLGEIPPVNWEYLISPLELRLPRSVYESATAAISALYQVSRRARYRAALEDTAAIAEAGAAHRSVLMAYDFHTDEDGRCYLVEVNTNASGFMLAALMQMTHQDALGGSAGLNSFAPLTLLRSAFAEELALSGKPTEAPRIAIIDQDILEQKMYAEFLMYRDWFRGLGWDARLAESSELVYDPTGRALRTADGVQIDLVYNRLTDFYLAEPAHESLRRAFLDSAACFTPNPREYWLLADKQRLVQFSQPEFLQQAGASDTEREAIAKVLIPTFEKSAFASEEEIWTQRKSLFFKPKHSYGGKSVYRGESVSRKVFERLMGDGDILIQKFQPAQRMPTDDPRSVLNNWKFDLRFYVYGDQVQMVAARSYQGQVTNFSSTMGGFTYVQFPS